MKHFLILFFLTLGSCISLGAQTATPASAAAKDSLQIQEGVLTASSLPVRSQVNKKPAQDSPGLIAYSPDIQKNAVAILSIIGFFGTPVLIIFLIFHFRHKNLKAKCEIAVKALEMGKEVPKNLFETPKEAKNMLVKGVTSTFSGIGIGIFLWAITGQFGVGCIGFMIMFIGVGQIIIYRAMQRNTLQQPSDDRDNIENTDSITGEK